MTLAFCAANMDLLFDGIFSQLIICCNLGILLFELKFFKVLEKITIFLAWLIYIFSIQIFDCFLRISSVVNNFLVLAVIL